MNKPSEKGTEKARESLRRKVLGLNEGSMRKSYYPALQQRVRDLELFRTLLDSTQDGIFLVKLPEGLILDANNAATSLAKRSLTQLKSFHFADLLPPGVWEEHFLLVLQKSSKPSGRAIKTQIGVGENLVDVDISISFENMDGVLFSIVVARDITQSLQISDALGKMNEVVRQSTASIMITDVKGVIQYVNPAFINTSQYDASEIIGRTPNFMRTEITPPEVYVNMWDTILEGNNWTGDICSRKKNGDVFWEHVNVSPYHDENGNISHFVSIKQDITESRRINEYLKHQQKMDALGRLAAGIAHDFNNILTVIRGNADMLEISTNDRLSELEADLLTGIQKSTGHAANLTRQLLAFSRKQVMENRVFLITELLRDMESMIRRLVPENIDFRATYFKTDMKVRADAGQLNQIILNLIVNAVHAMPDGGNLHVETCMLHPQPGEVCQVCNSPFEGPYAVIRVEDSGVGIQKEIHDKVFDAFFTTKEEGQGTGLGLSIVYGIVRQFNGHTRFFSEVGEGSTFEILLPAITDVVQNSKSPELQATGGNETILIVEDDDSVRRTLVKVLTIKGYTVSAVESATLANQVLEETDTLPDLVISDVVMPGISGVTFVQELHVKLPELRTLLISGYSHEGERIQELGLPFLTKPFNTSEILNAVRDILDGKTA
jgi:PAS domain S-box-containing protein